ncbi:TBC1 domain family member 10A isoform 5-T6 [Amazona ochrocephala]
MLNNWDKWMAKKHKKIRLRCQKGIPPSLRGRAWQYLSGSKVKLEQNIGKFDELDLLTGDPKWLDVIERDLHRQFPFHEMFVSRGGHGQQDLFRVLKAYTLYRPEEGYCQAQAPIAAVLLMHMPAEQAFWCLVQICEKYLPGYYSEKLEAIQLDGQILFSLLHKVSPVAYKHLSKQKIDPILYMTEWFMCAFSRTLPWSSVLRVWDMFFCEGRSSSPTILLLVPGEHMDSTWACSWSSAAAACLCLAHGTCCRAGLGQPRAWGGGWAVLGVWGHVCPKSILLHILTAGGAGAWCPTAPEGHSGSVTLVAGDSLPHLSHCRGEDHLPRGPGAAQTHAGLLGQAQVLPRPVRDHGEAEGSQPQDHAGDLPGAGGHRAAGDGAPDRAGAPHPAEEVAGDARGAAVQEPPAPARRQGHQRGRAPPSQSAGARPLHHRVPRARARAQGPQEQGEEPREEPGQPRQRPRG